MNSKNRDRIVSLDSLRGIFAILVAVFHFDAILHALVPTGSQLFVRKGYLGADFFFILSGFAVYAGYSRYFLKTISLGVYWKFIRQRFVRTYPLYIISLIWMWQIFSMFKRNFIGTDENTFNMTTLMANVLMVQAVSFDTHLSWNLASWAVSALWLTYFLFPFLVRSINKNTLGWLVIICGGYLSINYFLYPLSESISSIKNGRGYAIDVTHDFGMLRCFFGFILGMQIHKLYENKFAKKMLSLGMMIYIWLFILYGLYWIGAADLWYILVFASMVLGNSYDTGTLLKFGLFRYLGKISYSIYLMHIPLIFFIIFLINRNQNIKAYFDSLPTIIYLFIYLAALLAISTLTYQLIEKPSKTTFRLSDSIDNI